ncbi:DUF3784 domain-containing protein [Viridibacillus sp. YIM B01967]|uniref:DUF3784 domain-containing protein n=1 Tax=Viridibacillus soli TaxID=2798301 RepID=A0ABS1H2W8_9BACL|nr:DUF3784 domain-containing protein [Viridibacillus soli]MBK3493764.1 DUF3784 domain-containing protein [Viridibacillus soli]
MVLLIDILITSLISLSIAALGIFIYKTEDVELVAGYNEQKFKGDKAKFAKNNGLFCIALAILLFLTPFLKHLQMVFVNSITLIMIMLFIILVLYTSKQHK